MEKGVSLAGFYIVGDKTLLKKRIDAFIVKKNCS